MRLYRPTESVGSRTSVGLGAKISAEFRLSVIFKNKFWKNYSFSIVEVSGDNTPEAAELNRATILITTPEKWDGITRCADARRYVREVELLVIDEIHLLGVERGAVLEAIITRLGIWVGHKESRYGLPEYKYCLRDLKQ